MLTRETFFISVIGAESSCRETFHSLVDLAYLYAFSMGEKLSLLSFGSSMKLNIACFDQFRRVSFHLETIKAGIGSYPSP